MLRLADECLALAQGKLDAAERELQFALEVAYEIGNPPQLWKTLVALGDLRQAQGRADEAHLAYRDALGVIDSVAAGLTDEHLRRSFLESPQVRNVRQLAGGGRA